MAGERRGPPAAEGAGTGRVGAEARRLQAALRPLGRALLDHREGRRPALVMVRYDTGGLDVLDVASFFREPEEMGPVDRMALEVARGRVLDVGAGAGAHAVALEARGLEVTALELIPASAAVLRSRGLAHVVEGDLWAFRPRGAYDTVLALMNGAGLAGTRGRLGSLIRHLGSFLAPEGIILMDSADLTGDEGLALGDGRYPGELQLQLEYGGLRGDPFPHVFVDPETLATEAQGVGWAMEVLVAGEADTYLARLTRV